MRRLNVLHIITHLALGGATETVLTCCRLADTSHFQMAVMSGDTSVQEATLDAQAQADGTTLYHLPSLNRTLHLLADWRAYRQLTRWLRQHPVDVVHTHGSKAGFLGRMAAHRAGVPIVVHMIHGWGHHERQKPLARRFYILLERRAARVTDRFIAVAEANREKGLADGIGTESQYEIIHSCINIPAFRDVTVDPAALRTAFGIPLAAPVVGGIGRLAPQKAPDDFVRMATQIRAERPDTHFVWIGGGPLEAEIREQVTKAGLSSVFHLLGYRDDVPQLLRLFDVFVLTSLWEGLPRVFAQAMCASLPIVATRVDGAPEAVRDGENGYLVAPQDPHAQAVRVLSLLNDPLRRRAMGACGLSIVDPKFNERHMAYQIEQLYLTLAQQKGLISPEDSLSSMRAVPTTVPL